MEQKAEPRDKATIIDVHLVREQVTRYRLATKFADGLEASSPLSDEIANKLIDMGIVPQETGKNVLDRFKSSEYTPPKSMVPDFDSDGKECNYINGYFNLTVDKDGLVSLWDTERAAVNGKKTGEVYFKLGLISPQIESIRYSRKLAR